MICEIFVFVVFTGTNCGSELKLYPNKFKSEMEPKFFVIDILLNLDLHKIFLIDEINVYSIKINKIYKKSWKYEAFYALKPKYRFITETLCLVIQYCLSFQAGSAVVGCDGMFSIVPDKNINIEVSSIFFRGKVWLKLPSKISFLLFLRENTHINELKVL